MAQKRKADQTKLKARLMQAALSLADKKGWDTLSLHDIAQKTRMREDAVKKAFPDIWHIMRAVLKKLGDDTLASAGAHPGDDWRDNLMDIIMTRLELAGEHKPAFVSMLPVLLQHPKQAPRFGKDFYAMLGKMLSTAKAPKSFLEPLHVTALAVVYLSIVHEWTNDDTPDMAKTMAMLDRRIQTFEQFVDYTACRN